MANAATLEQCVCDLSRHCAAEVSSEDYGALVECIHAKVDECADLYAPE